MDFAYPRRAVRFKRMLLLARAVSHTRATIIYFIGNKKEPTRRPVKSICEGDGLISLGRHRESTEKDIWEVL